MSQTPAQSPPGLAHVPALDGVRGIAILAVVAAHAVALTPITFGERLVRLAADFGWVAVDLFFVLSGFLITSILLRAKGSPTYYRAYFWRRLLRILPLYVVYCVGLFAMFAALGQWDAFDLWPWYATYTANIRVALANAGWEGAAPFTQVFWSLCVEEQFYTIWPMVVATLVPRRIKQLALVLMVLALVTRVAFIASGNTFAAYVLLPARMDGLAAGAWLACVAMEPGGAARYVNAARLVLLAGAAGLAAMVLAIGSSGFHHPWMATVGASLSVLCSVSLLTRIVAPPQRNVFDQFWASPKLAIFGTYAYGLYFFNGPVQEVMHNMGVFDLVPSALLGSGLPRAVFSYFAVLSVTLGLAWLSWRLIEAPALRFKDRVPYGRPARPATPLVPQLKAPVVAPHVPSLSTAATVDEPEAPSPRRRAGREADRSSARC
jgi:peptidoglycan/LPS O-acetylase OafA/YrhL